MSDVEEGHSPASTEDTLDNEPDIKEEVPDEVITEHERRRHGVVVITQEEQRNARRAIKRLQHREREQPVRDATLRIPRASIEVVQSNGRQSGVGGSAWTENEDKKLRKGFKDGLSSAQIHDSYLPGRTADAIRKRKAKLQRV